MKRLIAIWAFAGLAAALCLAAVPIAGLKLTTGADGGGTNSWTNAVDYGTTGGVTLLNAMTTGQLALTRADAANVTGGIAVGFANAASNLAVLVQGTQVTVQGWAVAASNLAVALQGSQAVIRADVATVSNMADAAQTSAEVAEAIAAIHVTGIKYVASSNIVASGAGSNVVDGTYIPASTYGGYPTWTNTTGASVMFYSGGYWFINSEVNGGIWYYYDNGSGSGAPLSGTWLEYTGGVAPAPTMAYAPQTNTLTEAVGLYAPTGTLGTAAYQASSAFDAAGSALAATNGLALPFTAFTPTSRWVAATGGVARGLLLFDDPGLRWSGTNGYAILATNTAPDGYSFGAMQNNSEDVLQFGVRGTAAAGTTFGATNAGAAAVYSYASPLLLGSYGADPVVLGVNNAEKFRLTDAAGNTNVGALHVTGTLTGGGLGGLAYSNSIIAADIAGGLPFIGSSNGIGTNTTISGWLTAGAITGASAAVSGALVAGTLTSTNELTTNVLAGVTVISTAIVNNAAGGMQIGSSASSDNNGIAIGNLSTAASLSIAIGRLAFANDQSVAIGRSANAVTSVSTAIGDFANAVNEGVAVGYASSAPKNSLAVGTYATATASNAAVGYAASATGVGTVSVGCYATNSAGGTSFLTGHLIQTGAVSAASLNASGAITGQTFVAIGSASVASNLNVAGSGTFGGAITGLVYGTTNVLNSDLWIQTTNDTAAIILDGAAHFRGKLSTDGILGPAFGNISGGGLCYANTSIIFPINGFTLSDNTVQLGRSDYRFKDAYLAALTVSGPATSSTAAVSGSLTAGSVSSAGSITGATFYGNGVGLTNCTPVIRPSFIAAILQTNGYVPAITSQIVCARLVHEVGSSGYSTNTGNWTPPAGELEFGCSFRCRDTIAQAKYIIMYLYKNGAPYVDLWDYHTVEANELPLLNPVYYFYNDSATNVYSIRLWPETTNTFHGDQNSRWWGRVIKAD